MISWLAATWMLTVASADPQGDADLGAVMARYLEAAPMQVTYRYTIEQGNTEQGDVAETTRGTLYLSAPSVFRLSFVDKVYGSDGASVYLHDTNTHQTVIDSLRRSDMQLWMQLLSGQMPPGAEIVNRSIDGKLTRINFRGPKDQWQAELSVISATGALSRINVTEQSGLTAVIDLDPPQKWTPESMDAWIRLTDLAGERLDLR